MFATKKRKPSDYIEMETVINKLKELNIFNEKFHNFNKCEKVEIIVDFNENCIIVDYFNNGEIDEERFIEL